MLACPDCRCALAPELHCPQCSTVFPVVDGVPRLLPARSHQPTRQAFSTQWRLRAQGSFERPERLFWMTHTQALDFLQKELFPDLRPGDRILDAGCGSAEKAAELARRNPQCQVVGLDLGDHLRPFPDLPNLQLVQGDVLNPPFLPRSFQKVVSIGVLHHTGNCREAFQQVSGLVAPGGSLAVWLYPSPHQSPLFQRVYYAVRDVLFAGQGHRLPPPLLLALVRLLALGMLPGLPLFLLSQAKHASLYEPAPWSELYRSLVFSLYDNLSPPYQSRHSREEVMGWFQELGAGPVSSPALGMFTAQF